MTDRLDEIRKRHAGVPYIDADNDILWLIAEAERLREAFQEVIKMRYWSTTAIARHALAIARRALKAKVTAPVLRPKK